MIIRGIPYRRWRQKIKVIKRLKFYASLSNFLWYKKCKLWFEYIGTDIEFMYKNQTSFYKRSIHNKKRYKNIRVKQNREWKKMLYHIL